MWVIESAGFRIGPDWYTEATGFRTEQAAEAWLADNAHRLDTGDRALRIRLDTEEG